ncbi:MAG: methyltransferase domain-containing protein [Bacteroidota bacterium]|nr:methyltransferase domain-containing protein [Bacteroidota bacterium]
MIKAIAKFLVRKVPRPLLIKLSYLIRVPASWIYSGDNYDCPVCRKSFRKFLPYGNQGKENRMCPSCLSLERHRLLWLFLKNKTDFFSRPMQVLHMAPEQPFLKRFRNLENLDYTTADLVSPIADVKTDIRNLVFEDNRFDFIMCNHVLEHIDEEQTAMKELWRVLKPGGKAILQVPIDYERETTYEDPAITAPKERERLFGQYDHVRVYGKDYPNRLKKAGFEVDAIDLYNQLPETKRTRYRLDQNELIYLCSKPE